MPLTTSQSQTFLADNFAPWIKALDLRITEINAAGATLEMPITNELTRMGDVLSGQALAALADTSMVFACFGLFDGLTPVATTNLEVQFLRPGLGEKIRCEAHIVKPGKKLIFTRADMIARPSNKLVATATATFYLA
ncbi:PaaI family thioesterase [Lentibacter algarum]|uniref:PaaI family thioesterase n=1 Tax=Lentibacter algarum TaxID=576131 RepID=UPI001C08FB6E|nr:PaaI family thioesterase [Lentibacter algarum]MBU2982886.1 PaaI family thioesterase [Lentibacter algarum]